MGINVDVTSLRYFVHVATAESFVRGAALAHVSPPAISKAIQKLEDELNVVLFERTTRRVRITPVGSVLLTRAKALLSQLEELGSDIANEAVVPRGSLRVGAMEVFSMELLPAAIASLVKDHGTVTPLCSEMIPERMGELIAAGDLDVGFTIGAAPSDGIELHALGTSHGVLVCGRRHPLFSRGRVTPRDLQRHASVVPRFLGAEHLPSLDRFPDERLPRRVGATIELLRMGVELVAEGPYLGYFPEISVRRDMKAKRLRVLKGLSGLPKFELQAITRAGSKPKPAATELIRRVATALQAPRGA